MASRELNSMLSTRGRVPHSSRRYLSLVALKSTAMLREAAMHCHL